MRTPKSIESRQDLFLIKMKKTFLVALVMVVALAANAQKGSMYLGMNNIGGSASYVGNSPEFITGFWSTKSQTGAKSNTISISPELGYFIQDNLAIGLALGLGYETEGESFQYGIAPYARYYCKTFDKFSLYGQAQLSLAGTDTENSDVYWDLGIKPGIAYNLSDRFAITATYGFLGYAAQGDAHAGGLRLDASTLNFGLSMSF